MDDIKKNKPLQIIYLLICLLALYFSFKRNNGFEIKSFAMAFLFPFIYIPYYLGTEANRKNQIRLLKLGVSEQTLGP